MYSYEVGSQLSVLINQGAYISGVHCIQNPVYRHTRQLSWLFPSYFNLTDCTYIYRMMSKSSYNQIRKHLKFHQGYKKLHSLELYDAVVVTDAC